MNDYFNVRLFVMSNKFFVSCLLNATLLITPFVLSAQEQVDLITSRRASPLSIQPMSLNTGALSTGSIAINRDAQYQEMSPEQLLQEVFVKSGACAVVNNVKVQVYNWNDTSKKWAGTGRNSPRGLAYFNKAESNFPMDKGLILSTGNVYAAEGPNASDDALGGGIAKKSPVDADLQAILSKQGKFSVENFTVLEFDFIPTGTRMEFKYIFSSEEYPEYVESSFNDVFGFFVNKVGDAASKKNIALLPETDTGIREVSINNVNHGYSGSNNANYQGTKKISNKKFFVKNLKGSKTTEMDGYTTVLTATMEDIVPCQTYHMKIALGNAGDESLGSAVFLQANSFNAGNDMEVYGNNIEGMDRIFKTCDQNKLRITLSNVSPTGTYVNVGYDGTAVNGVHYVGLDNNPLPENILVPAGQEYVDIWFKATPAAQAGMYFNAVLYCPCPGMSVSASKRVTIYDFSSLETVNVNRSCANGNNGSITLIGIGGSNIYEYSINGGVTWQTDNKFSGLAPGQYTVKYRDVGSCNIGSVDVTLTSLEANAGEDKTQCGNTVFAMNGNQYGNNEVGVWSISGTNPGGVVIANPNSPTTTVTVPEGKTVTLQWKVSNSDCSDTDLVQLASKAASIDYENVYFTINVKNVGSALNLLDYVPKVPSSTFQWAPVAVGAINPLSEAGVVNRSSLIYNKTHIFKYTVTDQCKTNVERNIYMTVTGN